MNRFTTPPVSRSGCASEAAVKSPHRSFAWATERGEDGEETFRLEWIESGGPPVGEPGARGFGWNLVERLVRSAFAGEVEYRFAPQGVVWRLRCPAASVATMG